MSVMREVDQMGMVAVVRFFILISIFVTASGLTQGGVQAAPPPIETFGKRPMIDDVVMSPGGTHYAAVQWIEGKQVVAIYNLYATSPKDRVRLLDANFYKNYEEKVTRISWLNDDTVGVAIAFEAKRWGSPSRETRLLAAKADLSDIRQIPRVSRRAGKSSIDKESREGQFQTSILDYLDDDPLRILMPLDREGYGGELNVYKVKIANGALEKVTDGGSRVAWYMSDQQGRVRLRSSIYDSVRVIDVRPPESGPWETLLKTERSGDFDFFPAAFLSDPNHLLVSKMNESGFVDIINYDIENRTLGETVLALSDVDIDYSVTDRYTQAVTGFSYARDYMRIHYTDEQLKSIQASVDAKLPDTQNFIQNHDRNRSLFVILASGPKHPGTYYIYVRSGGQLLKVLERNAIPVAPEALGTMKRIAYQARDGVEIPAYLTTPPHGKAPYPMVIMPHGGPTARDYLTWDYQVQFLASRGYAVLQPQFRGSDGFGEDFRRAGYAQWGLVMQDDVTDGAKAMVASGLADPNRMCIVGSSYGGYAALMGAVVTPDLFQCAASFAGVTDILKMIAENRQYKFSSDNPPNVGSRKDDKDQLRDTSPINNIDVIEVPVLLVHGENDLAVDVDHSKRMAKALKKAGKPHKLVILKDGNHYLELERHRIRFLKELEAFLDKHIGN